MTRNTIMSPPSAGEILALLRCADDLRDDPATTDADRLAYFECKADLLARIAAHEHTASARTAARHADAQVRRLRERASTGGASGRW